MTKKRKPKKEKVDGLSNDDIRKIRVAIRKVWSWSHPRRLCLARAHFHPDGFPRCEKCKRKVPKVFADHVEHVGDVDGGFIQRLFTSSKNLQAICRRCHDKKTKDERDTERHGF